MALMSCRVSWTKVFAIFVLFLLSSSFAPAAIDWAHRLRRTSLQGIVTRMSPFMTRVATNPSNEPYYGVWRYHDFDADSYRKPRKGVMPSIPIVYVHGNAGCFKDMRSLGRFIGESNVKHRLRFARNYEDEVRRTIYNLYKRDGRPMPMEGEIIPLEMQKEAEDTVVAATPLLAAELFAVDYLEESNTQSGIILMKEARFLNYTMHLLVDGLLRHYGNPSTPSLSVKSLRQSNNEAPLTAPFATAVKEYNDTICAPSRHFDANACAIVQLQLRQYSSERRIAAELDRVRREGVWVWTESLGGIVAVVAALFAPHLYAGLVMAGAPLRYPPLLFDLGCVHFQRVVHDALYGPFVVPSNKNISVDWNTLFPSNIPSRELLKRMVSLEPSALVARVASVGLVNVHGGALEDIVPPRSSFLLRPTGRPASSRVHAQLLNSTPPHTGRRDVCTEEIRDCGMTLSHRGLVYAVQLLDTAADSLVRAAHEPRSSSLLGVESTLPPGRSRLFPMVVETLPVGNDTSEDEKIFAFTRSLQQTEEGNYRHNGNLNSVDKFMTKICTDATYQVKIQDLVSDSKDEAESWEPLQILLGATSFAPDDVRNPQVIFLANDAKEGISGIFTHPVTRLHLPTRRRDTSAVPGRVLRTAISFAVTLQKNISHIPLWVTPRFCFQVETLTVQATLKEGDHYTVVQVDRFDPLRTASNGDATKISKLTVETYDRFAFVRNIDSMFMETRLAITVRNLSVYPHVLCGSMRSFRLAMRGTRDVTFDEPESQMQYFYGPYDERRRFEHSWRPFHTTPFNVTNLYIVYVLSSEIKPSIMLHDLQLYEYPQWDNFKYWIWRFEQWTMRWMAVLATYSVPGKFAGSYTLLFLTLYLCFGIPRFAGEEVACYKFIRCLRALSPVFSALLFGVVVEFLCAIWAEHALTVCLMDDPPLVSDAALTEMMGIKEKLTLLFLYALPPRYEECRYSWIRLQTAIPADVMLEHLLHLLCGFCFAILLVVFEAMIFYFLGLVTFFLEKCVRLFCKFHSPRMLGLFLMLMWSLPIVMHIFIPFIHVSISTTFTCVLAYGIIWMIPHSLTVVGGPRYRWMCFLLTMVSHFSAHFEGLILVVRNYIIVPRVVLSDPERFETAFDHVVMFVWVQLCIGVVYVTVFLTRLHQGGIASVATGSKKTEILTSTTPSQEHYVIGDVRRKYPYMNYVLGILCKIYFLITFWSSLVGIRRPLEGTIPMSGLWALMLFMTFLIIRLW